MELKCSFRGGNELVNALRNIAYRVPENGRKVMHRAADKMELRAKLFVPHDTGLLEQSIRQEIQYEYHGRLRIDIVAGGIIEGVNVDDYAAEIHENYEAMVAKWGHVGKNTQAKRDANPGVYIGEHYITRAVDEHAEKLKSALIESVIATSRQELQQ